ncbi:hypothetical protein [Aureibacter tunicatorum]|uniref:Uncharacterized protein n=1 Tax=Aureibacter tunicatorum TaxID=866807 RepID=A0AAE3XMJ8_9BACT|nr:hypothetical protein [Aureibacter tunicatorum]MDR6238531.1 hypothetical protein [Aureibacter tunicatorum]BDD05537.1 hypothetical protein AUTU_30200 [Aureibacter tunicatorum]
MFKQNLLLILCIILLQNVYGQEQQNIMFMDVRNANGTKMNEDQINFINKITRVAANEYKQNIPDCAVLFVGDEERNQLAQSSGFFSVNWSTFNQFSCNRALPDMKVNAYILPTYDIKAELLHFTLYNFNNQKLYKSNIPLTKKDLKKQSKNISDDNPFEGMDTFIQDNICPEEEVTLNLDNSINLLSTSNYESLQEQIKADLIKYLKTAYYSANPVVKASFDVGRDDPGMIVTSLFQNAYMIYPNASIDERIAFANDMAFILKIYTLFSIHSGELETAKKANDRLYSVKRGAKSYENTYQALKIILTCLNSSDLSSQELYQLGIDARKNAMEQSGEITSFDKEYFSLHKLVINNSKDGRQYDKKLFDLSQSFSVPM